VQYTNLRGAITKERQIEKRRARLLELSAQGLTHYEIVANFEKIGISISQKTISNDLAFLKEDIEASVNLTSAGLKPSEYGRR
jgi:hypothetical protein